VLPKCLSKPLRAGNLAYGLKLLGVNQAKANTQDIHVVFYLIMALIRGNRNVIPWLNTGILSFLFRESGVGQSISKRLN
jgi:hypothetical protein